MIKEAHKSEYEEIVEPNGNKRLKMKGMRSEDIGKILTSDNFKQLSPEFKPKHEVEVAREILFKLINFDSSLMFVDVSSLFIFLFNVEVFFIEMCC